VLNESSTSSQKPNFQNVKLNVFPFVSSASLFSFRGCKITYSFPYSQIIFQFFQKNNFPLSRIPELALLPILINYSATQKTGGQR